MTTAALHPLKPEEAERLYALKTACFSETYLGYSVFRSPRAAAHLRGLAFPQNASRHPILVAGDFEGYIQAVIRDATIHLDYIGVRPDRGGGGLGGELLSAFEEAGRTAGATRATLDVFESNPAALAWYERRGYVVASRTPSVTVDLGQVAPGEGFGYEALESAREEEAARGFGFARFADGDAALVLIAGDTLRTHATEEAAARLAAALRADFPERVRLVLGGVRAPTLPALDRQLSIRMEKTL